MYESGVIRPECFDECIDDLSGTTAVHVGVIGPGGAPTDLL
jgi:hypothetical protein